jgi:hypothetical protein
MISEDFDLLVAADARVDEDRAGRSKRRQAARRLGPSEATMIGVSSAFG